MEDIDGDGLPELLAGAPLAHTVRVYSGRTWAVLIEVTEADNEYGFGHRLASIGDFDQDGTPDFAAGDPGLNSADWPNVGAVYVYSGVDGSRIVHIEGQATPYFELGWQVAGLGDVNNDGFTDLGATAGFRRVRIYRGPDGEQIRQHFHPDPLSKQPAVAGVGDMDADGCDDYVIGWPRDSTVAGYAGKVVVHSGRTGAVIHEILGELQGDYFGVSVAGVGDMDADGVPDFAAAAPGTLCLGAGCAVPDRALVRVYSGLDASLLHEWDGSEETTGIVSDFGAAFGLWIYGGGDLNGDGRPDLLVAAPYDGPNTQGSISMYSGLTGERLWRVLGESTVSELHYACFLGDVNHDGLDDFAIGNPTTHHGGQASGRIHVYGGDPGELTHHCTAAPTSVSAGIMIAASGAISIGNNFLTLEAEGAVPDQTALFFYGPPTAEVPFGDGYSCTGPPRFRLGPPLTVTPTGTLERPLDFTLPPLGLGPGTIHAGSTWSFQLFCRDPASPGGGTFNLSDALAITFPP